jgi:Predicted aminoglycoside phosphotransferase
VITVELVKQLIVDQFPEYQHLPISQVLPGGNDNRTFRLGDNLSIRIPSNESYVPQVEKEAKWLPYLTSKLSLPITTPIKLGKPSRFLAYPWSINTWLKGQATTSENIASQEQFAKALAQFLTELATIVAPPELQAGTHNFYRGGSLMVYDKETQIALSELAGNVDVIACQKIWQQAIKSKWQKPSVWVHGDMAVGNILVENGQLAAVIDFGCMGVGDPACDLVMAWTFFNKSARQVFKANLPYDEETWNRGRGWALWKALITYETPLSKKIIAELLSEEGEL